MNFERWGKVAVMGIVQSILVITVGLKIVGIKLGIKVFHPGTHMRNLQNYNCVPIPSMSLW
jgi:hypothetical protein